MQPLLFSSGELGFDARFRQIRRLDLGNGAWLEHQSGWLSGHEHVFDVLARGAPWRAERRWMYQRDIAVPRLVASLTEEDVTPYVLREAAESLSTRYRRPMHRLHACYYRDGRDSVAEHGDKMGPLIPDCVIGIVSVGSPRTFLIRPASGGRSLRFQLGWGDLLVMGGSCQKTHVHGVPKQAHAEPRISIQFREALPAAPA